MADDQEATVPGRGKDEPLLKELRERFDYATDQWREIRKEAATDMRYVSGDPWKSEDREARDLAKRPCIAFDELNQYTNQLANEVRQHKRSIQVTPTGNGANDKLAQARADLIRQIEYRSNAQQVYTTGFDDTVNRSYGFWRIKPKYVNDRSFDQELLIERIVNPDMVTIDPDALSPDGSDMGYAFIHESWSIEDYKRRWPKAKVRDFDSETAKIAPAWLKDGKRIQIAEYWAKQPTTKTLYQVQMPDGQLKGVYEDELKRLLSQLPANVPILQEREVETHQVCQYMTNGIEILEKTEMPGPSIPIVCCFGKVLYFDSGAGTKRIILSLVRLARDPAMFMAYAVTGQAEQIGMATKFPYFVRRGSLSEENKLKIQASLHEPVAFIEVEMTAENLPPGVVPEMPVRNPFEPAIQALEVVKEGARRSIQAAMGISPLPTSAQRKNEKSGVALQEMRNAEQQGSFHFIDHYEASITRTGTLLNELIPHYYDTARDVTVRDQASEASVLRINDPSQPDKETGETVDMTAGEYDVTLSTGPHADSEREAASDFADNLAGNPQLFPLIGDLVVKLKNLGPIGDEIAERLHAMLPPQIQALDDKEGKPPIPPEVQQQMQQMQQMIEVLSKELEAKTKAVETEQVKAERDVALNQSKQASDDQRTAAELALKREIEFRKLEVQLQIEMAKLGNAQMMARAEAEQDLLHQHNDQDLQREEMAVDHAEASLDRKAEQDNAADERAFQASEGAEERKVKQDTASAS